MKRKTTEQFIEQATKVHNGKYAYTNTIYINNKIKVNIVCRKHGIFSQEPSAHLKGQGCPHCAIVGGKLDTEKFIRKASEVHGDKYKYDDVEYKDSVTKVVIICKKHGKFKQRPNDHIQGKGCSKCGREATIQSKIDSTSVWSYSGWKTVGENSPNFDSFKLYIIECSGFGENFIKVGKTFLQIGKRFKGNNMPYEWKVLKCIEGSAKYISELEEELHRNLKQSSLGYIPSIDFKGKYECYKAIYKEILC